VLPFTVELKPGIPIANQILYAVKKAVVSGQMAAGTRFPSVRQLSQELRINPNTAHKIAMQLVAEGVLTTTPGVGSVVAEHRPAEPRERAELLGGTVEQLVVEAKNLGVPLEDVQSSVDAHWRRLGGDSK